MKIHDAVTTTFLLLLSLSCGSDNPKNNNQGPAPKVGPSSGDETGHQTDERKNEDSATPANPAGTPAAKPPVTGATTAPTCEEQWQNMLRYSKVGDFSEYETTSKTTFSGQETVTVSKSRQEVAAVSADKISWKYHSEVNGQSNDSVSDFKKEDYIKNCRPSDGQHKPVEEGDETITVKAGTFQTHWLKMLTEQNGVTITTKVWMNKSADREGISVKTESSSVFTAGTALSVTELVATNR